MKVLFLPSFYNSSLSILTYLTSISQKRSSVFGDLFLWFECETKKIEFLFVILPPLSSIILAVNNFRLLLIQTQLTFLQSLPYRFKCLLCFIFISAMKYYIICVAHKCYMRIIFFKPFVKYIMQIQISQQRTYYSALWCPLPFFGCQCSILRLARNFQPTFNVKHCPFFFYVTIQ